MLEITSISARLTAGLHGLRAEIEALERQSNDDSDPTGLN
jgi:hypothetical protein